MAVENLALFLISVYGVSPKNVHACGNCFSGMCFVSVYSSSTGSIGKDQQSTVKFLAAFEISSV